jgi:transcriptional regulator
MYRPAHFEESRVELLHPFVQAHPLGLLITQDAGGMPVVNPIPWLLETHRGTLGTLVGHVARANPVWQSFGSTRSSDPLDSLDSADGSDAVTPGPDVLVVFQGPNAYVSPQSYPSKARHGRVVPTWNYAVVEARGPLRILAPEAAHGTVSRLTGRFEGGRDRPWAVTDAPADYVESMLTAIVCLEIPLTSLHGKFKLSQNRDLQDRSGVLRRMEDESAAVATWMARTMAPPPSEVS